jgi:septal ring factor EnvC (AmiA/AmiB activator)
MGLGSKAKALQTVADRAEQLYAQLMDVRERLARIEDDIDDSSDRVVRIENELEEQRVILDALAEDAGLDIERRIAEASITHAESGGDPEDAAGTDATDDGSAATGEGAEPDVTADEPADATADDE